MSKGVTSSAGIRKEQASKKKACRGGWGRAGKAKDHTWEFRETVNPRTILIQNSSKGLFDQKKSLKSVPLCPDLMGERVVVTPARPLQLSGKRTGRRTYLK